MFYFCLAAANKSNLSFSVLTFIAGIIHYNPSFIIIRI